MDVITEKPRPVVPHCGACCGASGPGQGAHAQYRPARSEAVTWPTGPGCGGRGRRRGLAGLRDRPLRAVRLACGDHAGRPPPTDAAHGRIKQPGPTAGSNNTWNTSYTRNTSGPLPPPTDTAHRCHPRAHQAARPHRHAPPDTRHQTRAQIRATRHAPPDTRPEHHPDPQPQPQTQQKAGRNPSVPARPRYSATIGAVRQVSTSAPLQSAVSSARPPCHPCRSSRR